MLRVTTQFLGNVSLNASRSLARMMGARTSAFALTAVNTAISKTGGEGVAGAAAHLARAAALLGRPTEVLALQNILTDVEAAIKATAAVATNEGKLLHRHALVLRLRTLNVLLDEKERLAANGASNESDVSTIRGLVRAAHADLLKACPTDPFTLLGMAEFELYEGNTEAAVDLLSKAEQALRAPETHIGASGSPAASVALKIRSTVCIPEATSAGFKSKTIRNVVGAVTSRPAFATEELTALREQLNAPASLSEEELVALSIVLDDAETGHHAGDFFALNDAYRTWTSHESEVVVREMRQFLNGEAVDAISPSVVGAIAAATPAASFHAPESDVKRALTEKATLDNLLERFGTGPQSSLSSGDAAFWDAVKAVDAATTISTTEASKKQTQLAAALVQQLMYRVTVSKALALDRLNQPHEALKLLDGVVAANDFVFMWKALLARGRIRQNLGLVAEADADFKALFQLRKAYAKADIPLRDEYRTKSAF